MFNSWTIGNRNGLVVKRPRRPVAFHARVETLEGRALLVAASTPPYWSGNWNVAVTPPGGQAEQGTLDVYATTLEPDTGWWNLLIDLTYHDGMGNSTAYNLMVPPHVENPDLATITGRLATSVGGAQFGEFTLTAVSNPNFGTDPDTFVGSFALDPNAPQSAMTTVTGTFGSPPDNPSLTSVVDFFGETVPRAQPVLSFLTQPGGAAQNQTLSPVEVLAPLGSTVSLSVASNSSGATLSGTTVTETAANGIATFDNLSVTAPGTFTLVAAASGAQNATSDGFIVAAPPTPTPKTDTLGFSFSAVNVPIVDGRKRVNGKKGARTIPVQFAATITNNGPSALPAGRVQLELLTFPFEIESFGRFGIISSPDGGGGTVRPTVSKKQVRMGIHAPKTWFLQYNLPSLAAGENAQVVVNIDARNIDKRVHAEFLEIDAHLMDLAPSSQNPTLTFQHAIASDEVYIVYKLSR